MLIATVFLVFVAGVGLGSWLTLWHEANITHHLVAADLRPESMPSIFIEEGRTVVLPRGVPRPWKGLVIQAVPRGGTEIGVRSVVIRPEDFNDGE